MKLLAVETSTDACSVALWIDGAVLEEFALLPREHTKHLLPMMDRLMAQAELRPSQLDAIALSQGPGSFTGVRIAGAAVQGIALGASLPVVPVSTLAAIAQDVLNRHPSVANVFTALDARMDEIFWGCYERDPLGIARLWGEEIVTPPASVNFHASSGIGAGSGWGAYQEILGRCLEGWVSSVEVDVWPKASCIAQIGAMDFANGHSVPVEEAMPVYLRDKVAKKQSER